MAHAQLRMGERRLHHTEMRQKSNLRETFFSMRDERPMSVATEFVDMDWDEDIISEGDDNSPRNSVNSSGGQPSITTLSSYDEAPTPKHSPSRRDNDAAWSHSVEGPTGPHLFRNSLLQSLEEDHHILTLSPITPKTAYPMDEAFNLPIFREPLPIRRPSGPFAFYHGRLDSSGLIDWTPEMVAQSMLDAGMEHPVAERFVENDISGAILMTLKFEDLKELSIQSFGIRTKVWAQVQTLRDSRPSSPRAPTPIQDEPSREVRREARASPEDPSLKRCRSTRRRPRNPSHDDIISPLESVSIVGIEQVIPEPHTCSKGEKCSTYRKRQRIIEEVRRLNPNADIQSGAVVISGDPGNPLTARALDPHEIIRPFSEANTSVVASSDVLGPGSMAPLQYIQAATLRAMQEHHHDPQENVRQFLDFQQGASNEVPPTPPFEMLPSAMAPKQGLRQLPKLSIPGRPAAPAAPSRLSHQVSVTPEQQQIEEFVPYQMDKADPISPDLQTRNPYRFGTPFSEMDVPVTMVPLDRIERNVSQSVPPEMNYHSGASTNNTPNPPARAMSRASARRPSFPVMPAVNENTPVAPPQRQSPLTSSPQRSSVAPPRRQQQQQQQQQPTQAPPRAAYPWSPQAAIPVRQAASNSTGSLGSAADMAAAGLGDGITYAGHMRKRRTRMLRTEWNDGYFTLKGTRLAMHKDAVTLDRSLEYVDIDDYAIACSSLASQSKLSAAFKRMHILSGSSGAKDAESVGAFAFQLIPQNGVPASKLRKRESGFSFSHQHAGTGPEGSNGTGKTHHFAVKNKDERIDWMRELMLAKALRQKGEGFEVNRNGNQI